MNASVARKAAFAWRYGDLVARVVGVGIVVLLLLLAGLAWQGQRLQRQAERLSGRAATLRAALDAKSAAVRAARPADVIQTLPDSPSVAQIMQTLQQAAAGEGARVESLQADDHAPTDTALGHLDLVLSIRAPYPSILVVLQQVLDRYPGATLRQVDLAHTVAPTTTLPMVTAPVGAMALPSTSESEARVTLSVWRRPAGVAQVAASAMTVPSASDARSNAVVPASVPTASAVVRAARVAASGAAPASGAR